MQNNNEKLSFPIKGAIVCPTCGSDKKIAQQYFDELEAEGKIPKGSIVQGAHLQIPIPQVLMGPLVPAKPEIPVLMISFEVCGNCFTFFSTQVSVVMLPAQVQLGQKGNRPELKPPFGRG